MEKLTNIFSYICHQNPERSFVIDGFQFFLCARCTGIYGFLLIILIISPLVKWNYDYKNLFLILLISVLINLITYINIFDINVIRFILGGFIGTISGLIIIKSVKILFCQEEQDE